jgi:hypothetical protein
MSNIQPIELGFITIILDIWWVGRICVIFRSVPPVCRTSIFLSLATRNGVILMQSVKTKLIASTDLDLKDINYIMN